MKFAALGRTAMLHNAIVAAVEAGHEPTIIVTCKASPEYAVKEDDFRRLAEELGCPFHITQNTDTVLPALRDSGAQVGISVNWINVIREPVINLFPHGIINAHGGDLPRYRGNACQAWAIINGEKEVVVTLHGMTEGLDEGPIHRQRSIPLANDIYIGDVMNAMERHVPEMFVECLDAFEQGTATPVPQRTDVAPLRCYPRNPSDGLIDWHRSADDIARLVRASAEPYDGAFSFLDGDKLTIWKAHAIPAPYESSGVPGQVVQRFPDGSIAVLCAPDLLIVEEVQMEGDARTQPATIIRSTRTRLGMNMHEEMTKLRARLNDLEMRLSQGV